MKNPKDKLFPLCTVEVPINFHPVVVGKICSAYGVLGWLKVVSFSEELHDIMNYQPWFINIFSIWRRVYLESWKRCHDNFRFVVKFKEIIDRDVAQLLNNHKIFVDVLQFPNLCKGEYYWKDIIGFRVLGMFGYEFGIIVDLIETGSNDVLVVENSSLKGFVSKFSLIPFIVNTVIKNVDCSDRIIYVDWDPKY